VLGGIGAALFLQKGLGWTACNPVAGAVVAAILSALLIGLVSLYAREREDTVIGALWALGMAVGLLFLSRTPGYVDAMSYLFGNILLLAPADLWVLAGLDGLVLLCVVLFHTRFLAVCFDDEFARLRGVHVEVFYLLLLCLTALTVVLLVRIVGVVMVIALLTLPAAVAGLFARRLWGMMGLAIAICLVLNVSGIAVSYTCDLPAGPTIIVLAGALYLVVLGVRWALAARRRDAVARRAS
jgi:zinc transport system permease protein